MAVLIRTRDVPAEQRYDAWRAIVCDTLGPLDFRSDPDVPLRGQIDAGLLGGLGVGRVQTSTPHSVHRTPGLIRRDSPELYRVLLPLSGSLHLVQDGRVTRLSKGELAVYDFTRPYELAYDSAVHLAVFSLPHALLAVPAHLNATPISTTDGTAALAAPLLSRVALDLETYQPDSAARLSGVVMDLLAATFAERAQLPPGEAQARTQLLVIHAFIEAHLGDPGLDPATIAAAHHVSLRHLHRLFAAYNSSVATWIRHRRLERCRRDLADPAMHATTVSTIAARWGLLDSAHFSRLFRTTYGMPPAEYRRSCLMPGTDGQSAGAGTQATGPGAPAH